MALPPKHWLDSLDALNGAPAVTHPFGGTDYPRIERTFFAPLAQRSTQPSTLSDYAGSTLVLVQELSRDHQRVKLYVRYDTLPGPWIPFTRYDDNLGPIQGRRREVLAAGQAASQTATTTTTYEAMDGSHIVSWEIEETNSDGSGAIGASANPAYPFTFADPHEDERGPVQVVSQMVRATGAESGSIAVRSNALVSPILTAAGTGYADVFAVTFSGGSPSTAATGIAFAAGGLIYAFHITNPGAGYGSTPSVVLSAGGGSGGTATVAREASLAVLTQYEPVNQFRVRRSVETRALPSPLLTTSALSDAAQGDVVSNTSRILDIGAAAPTVDFKTLEWRDDPLNERQKRRRVTTLSDSAFPVLYDYDRDEEYGSLITTSFQVIAVAGITVEAKVRGREIQYKHIDKWRSLRIERTWSTPPDFTEYRHGAYHFETVLRSYNWSTACGTDVDARFGRSVMALHRVAISYSTSDPAAPAQAEILQVMTNTFRYGAFSVSDVLNDALTVTFTGTCSRVIALPASKPTATQYLALDGTWVPISIERVPDRARGGLTRKSVTSVFFPTP